MAGITSIGAYIPMYRLNLEEITKFWLIKGANGEKAVAGYDEDSITMAAAAAFDCLKGCKEQPQGLFLATTTNPYREKQGAAVIASALDLKRESLTVDFSNSLRAGTIAMKSAIDAVKSGSVKSHCGDPLPPWRIPRWNVKATSSGERSEPSWNFTLFRILKR